METHADKAKCVLLIHFLSFKAKVVPIGEVK